MTEKGHTEPGSVCPSSFRRDDSSYGTGGAFGSTFTTQSPLL
jgi:hypothetical protein